MVSGLDRDFRGPGLVASRGRLVDAVANVSPSDLRVRLRIGSFVYPRDVGCFTQLKLRIKAVYAQLGGVNLHVVSQKKRANTTDC